MYAEVIPELSIEKRFDYSVPQNMLPRLRPGMRAWVPFGARRIPGYIVRIKDTSRYNSPKSIIRLIDREPLLSDGLIKLAEWMSVYYACPLGYVFKAMLPYPARQISPIRNKLKYVRRILPSIDMEALEKKAPKQARVMRVLSAQKTAVKAGTLAKMANVSPPVITALHKKGFVDIFMHKEDKDPYGKESFQREFPHMLTDEQKRALNTIKSMKAGTMLLYGITGSGKTEVYIRAIEYILSLGKSAIVTVPEISLTPQTISRFKSRFASCTVAVLHSRLSAGERYDQWEKIRRGGARIVIGARSAVFAPVQNLGLVVVDEEHERTYKQEESPRYNGRDTAVKRAEIEHAAVVLGSATPSLESYYMAQKGVYKMVKLTRRIDNRPLASVRTINLKEEIKRHRRMLTFSPLLLARIRDRLQKKQQIILFLNRRGFSPFIICRKCGFVIRCRDCTTALTYHQAGGRLVCHTCGFTDIVPPVCPECGNPHIRYSGMGTQRVESQVARFFPQARIQRMDTDVTTAKGSHGRILDKFRSGEIDILVGTQMIAKGLDFPNVTLVGVISADIALHLPDFRAGEHTFQLLTQVAGRAGRGAELGEVIIQTMTPDHPAIKSAVTQDYSAFAESELGFRRELRYPPYDHFINILFRSRNPQKAELTARYYHKTLGHPDVKIFGPIPAPINKLRGYYRWQVLLRSHRTEDMLPLLKKIKKHAGVIITSDIDPISML